MAPPINVAAALKGMKYPGNPEQLAEQAEENGASTRVIMQFLDLPEKKYASQDEVEKALAGLSDEDEDEDDDDFDDFGDEDDEDLDDEA